MFCGVVIIVIFSGIISIMLIFVIVPAFVVTASAH